MEVRRDDAGRLKTVSRGGQLRATYYYDHKHRRTRKVTTAAAPQGAKTLVYHYDDQDRLIAETTQTGEPVRSYLWADATLLAQVEYVAPAPPPPFSCGAPPIAGSAPNKCPAPTPWRPLPIDYRVSRELLLELDHLGTPRQAREDTGTVVWRWESDGYGNTLPDEDPDGNGQKTYVYLRFPGQYFDEESGLHYNWHRYYVPRLGRYLSADPIGLAGGSMSLYTYADNAPTMYTDPLGLWGCPAGTTAVPMPGNEKEFPKIAKCEPNSSENPNKKICPQGECAAGLPPVRPEDPCERQCKSDPLVKPSCFALGQAARLAFGIPGMAVSGACNAADFYQCVQQCRNKKPQQCTADQ